MANLLPKAPRTRKPTKPTCPRCGSAHVSVMETFIAYHPVTVEDDGISVNHALGQPCPSNHFNDGDSDLQGYCHKCSTTGSLEDFGIVDWDWDR